MIKKTIFSGFVLIFLAAVVCAQDASESVDFKKQNQSLDLFPLSPVIGIYALHYTQKVTSKDAFIVSPSYMKIKYEGIGNTNAPGIIAGYRRYLWKNLHVDYQLMPMFDRFYSSTEDKTYPWAFDLWNEFRLGYEFDFNISRMPWFINVQWPLGFALYSDAKGKPEAFKAKAEKEPLFYFPPLFFVGFRF